MPQALEAWPQLVNDVLVEPGSGVVRIYPIDSEPIELDQGAMRVLAEAAPGETDQLVLAAAAEEARRQGDVLTELMEGRC